MIETAVAWTNVLVFFLAALYVLTSFIANEPSSKIGVVIYLSVLLTVIVTLASMLHMVIIGEHKGSVMLTIVLLAILLIERKEFLQNIKETTRKMKSDQ